MAERHKEINNAYQRGDATEHTHRPALEALIEGLGKKITATNEPRRKKCGAPDLLISRREKKVDKNIGYIETKAIGKNLSQEPEKITIARELAGKMAYKAQMMRDIIKETFSAGNRDGKFARAIRGVQGCFGCTI
jgi:hypothetical protein